MITRLEIAYIVIIVFSGLILIWWSRKKIYQTLIKLKKRILGLKKFESLKTETPIEDPVEEAMEAALESVETRFSNIRNLLYFSAFSLLLVLLLYPFLNDLPAVFISILVAASGIITGIAARPIIENIISGIVISFSGLIRVGDTIMIDDKYGTVEDITLTHTVIKIWNWQRYVIPNSTMLSKETINWTLHDPFHWSHVEFIVAYESDLKAVKSIAIEAAKNSRYWADYEDPRFWIMEMNESSYKCWLAAWAKSSSDAWELRNDIRTDMIIKFKEQGIRTHRFEISCNGQNPSDSD